MIELSRIVRILIGLGGSDPTRTGFNTFAGWPTPSGLAIWCELEVRCRGVADRETGYLVNIAEIDAAVRGDVLPILEDAVRSDPCGEPAMLLEPMLDALNAALKDIVHAVRWRLTPYHSVEMATHTRDRILVRETFEFAAAHRLNCRELTPEQNRALFGKCNNPSGHGHNYTVEAAVEIGFGDDGGLLLGRRRLEEIVHERVIRRFDHKNLDLDTEEFAGINSSVENIARVCFDLLADRIAQENGLLRSVTVWETSKTSCTYPA